MSAVVDERTITKEQYWQATGLLALAHKYEALISEVEIALNETLGCQKRDSGDYYDSHVSDAIWNGYSIDVLLNREGVKVSDESRAS